MEEFLLFIHCLPRSIYNGLIVFAMWLVFFSFSSLFYVVFFIYLVDVWEADNFTINLFVVQINCGVK